MPIDPKKSKRRRYIRYAIELRATVVDVIATTSACTILDFCGGGFFLELDNPIPLNQSITVRFTTDAEIGGESFDIQARVVHISGNGIGVAADNMPVSVFSALTKQANAHFRSVPLDKRNSGTDKASRKHSQLAFKQMLLERLPALIDEYFASLNAGLRELNLQSQYFANESVLDDLATDLSQNRKSVTTEFCASVIAQIDAITQGNESKKPTNRDDTPLSLIDKEDFDDWLTLSAIIRKLSNHFEDALSQLAHEFNRVFGLSRAKISNPIRPAVLCESFRELVLQFELSNKTKEALYRVFERTLYRQLGGLYEQAHALLSQLETADVSAAYTPYRAAPSQDRRSTAREDTVPSFNAQQQYLVAEHNPHSFKAPAHAVQASVGAVAGKLLDLLGQLSTAADAQDLGTTFPPGMPGVSRFDGQDIATAIARLETLLDSDPMLRRDPAKLNTRIRETLERGDKTLSARELQQLDIYSGFFETLYATLAHASPILPYLEKAHLPLLSLCLQGDDFLDSADHPARKILNQLAALEPAIKNQKIARNVNVKNKLDALIERLEAKSVGDPEELASIEHELADIVKQVTKAADLMVKRLVEAHEGEQKLEIAKREIQGEIDQRLAGRSVPAILPMLLDAGWQQLLVVAELNKDKHRDEKQKLLSVFDDLLFWLYEQESILKIQAGSIHSTIEFIGEQLKPVCQDPVKRGRVVEDLTALLLGIGEPKTKKRLETVKIEAPTPAIVPIADDWSRLVEQLQVGDWLTIAAGTAGPEPMKLVWIGNVVEIYLFVNRDGSSRLDLGKLELAGLLRSGAARIMENLDEPLVDRAANSMLQNMHEKLLHSATHDPITELITRDEFVKRLKHEMGKLGDSHHMLCHMEVLDFRLITNICGVEAGEQLLKRLARQTAERLRDYDIFARLGNNSFAILFKHCSAEEGYEKSKKLVRLLDDTHFQWQDKSFAVGVSMGLVPFGDASFDVHQLLQQADSACISAECTSPSRVLMFSDSDENLQRQNKLHEWIGHIDNVLAQDRLFVRCQQIAPLNTSDANHQHYEILLGVRDEVGNIIPPDHFIPAVERCKRMPEIDRWIIGHVFAWIEQHREQFDRTDGFSINLSGQSINSEEFLELLTQILTTTNIRTDKLTFEITETVASENLAFTNRFIKTIKQFGCKFSLDDFGSGYSSYSYLKHLNVDYLKIDGTFVKDILNNRADVAIVKSMNEIAHSLGLKTIAEYVENQEIRDLLMQIGVDYGQGYAIHKPVPLSELVLQAPSTSGTYFFESDSFWEL